MYVVFTESDIEELKPFRRIPFSQVCEITYKLEMLNREDDEIEEISEPEFYLIDDEGTEIYSGKLEIGSGFADHIYDHICKKLNEMQLTEEEEEKKFELLEMLKKEVPLFDQDLDPKENLNNSKKVKNGTFIQRIMKNHLYRTLLVSGGIFTVIGLIFLVVFNSIGHSSATKSSPDEALLQALRYTSIQQYEKATEEFEKLNFDDLTAEDKKTMLYSYLLTNNIQKAIDKDPSFVESAITYLVATNNMDELASIRSDAPAIRFEQANLNKDYETVINLHEKISLDDRRQEIVVNAFITTKRLDQAFAFAKKVKNEELQEKVKKIMEQKWK